MSTTWRLSAALCGRRRWVFPFWKVRTRGDDAMHVVLQIIFLSDDQILSVAAATHPATAAVSPVHSAAFPHGMEWERRAADTSGYRPAITHMYTVLHHTRPSCQSKSDIDMQSVIAIAWPPPMPHLPLFVSKECNKIQNLARPKFPICRYLHHSTERAK